MRVSALLLLFVLTACGEPKPFTNAANVDGGAAPSDSSASSARAHGCTGTNPIFTSPQYRTADALQMLCEDGSVGVEPASVASGELAHRNGSRRPDGHTFGSAQLDPNPARNLMLTYGPYVRLPISQPTRMNLDMRIEVQLEQGAPAVASMLSKPIARIDVAVGHTHGNGRTVPIQSVGQIQMDPPDQNNGYTLKVGDLQNWGAFTQGQKMMITFELRFDADPSWDDVEFRVYSFRNGLPDATPVHVIHTKTSAWRIP